MLLPKLTKFFERVSLKRQSLLKKASLTGTSLTRASLTRANLTRALLKEKGNLLKESLKDHFQKLRASTASFKERLLKRLALRGEGDLSSEVRRLQFIKMGVLCLIVLGISAMGVFFLFNKASTPLFQESVKPIPKFIETASDRLNVDEMWRHKMEQENIALLKELEDIKKSLAGIKKVNTSPSFNGQS